MNKLALGLIIITAVLILGSIQGCGQNSSLKEEPSIFAYGDSVTYGAFTYNVSYVNDVANILNKPFVNKAVSGTGIESSNQYPLIMNEVWPVNSIVIFTPGANDSSEANNQDYINQYTQDLNDILTKASKLPITFYLGTPVTPLNNSQGWSASDIEVFAQINRNAVAQVNSSNIVLVDFNSEYVPTSETDADTYHPNALGYNQMTQIFMGAM